MDQIPFGLIILLVFAVAVAITLRTNKSRTVRTCPHCGSQKMKQISHETISTKPIDLDNSRFLPGADIRLQLEQDLTFHCQHCNRTSTIRVTSTP